MEPVIMSILAALVSATVSSTVSSLLPKFCKVISKLRGKTVDDVNFIRDELLSIQGAIIDYSIVGRSFSASQRASIAQLRHLAYDIEDCLDCFQANKTSTDKFARQIAELKTRSIDTRNRIKDYSRMNPEPALAPAAALEVVVPEELQELLGRQSEDFDKLNCLLYFCMFPHDHHARRNPLIRRWLAEGLVQGEDAAVKNLKNLIDGKIINTTAKSINGMMKRCQPPDQILRFIYQQSRSTNFMLFCDDMARLLQTQAECSTRRLSLYLNKSTTGDLDLPDLSRLHTLAVFHGGANLDGYEAILKFTNYEVLRVLDLKECAPLCERQISAVCKLLLLKYLSFRGDGIHRLPSEIGELAWLETLDVMGSEIVTVHKEVLMMPRLKHLLGKFQLSTKDNILGWTATEQPGKFLKQKSVLQTLSGFVTGERRGFPQLMILMRKLRKVKIWCKSNASKENLGAISEAITKFIRDGSQEPGRSLSIDFQEGSGRFLNTLRAPGSLTSLKLHGNLSKFPQFVARLSGIEELCLSSTALSWNDILAGLSELGILKYLKLVEDKLGPVQILLDDLRSLQRICLVCVPDLDITIEAKALPLLESFHLICQDLNVLPGTPGMEIAHMARLQEVGLHSQVDQAKRQRWEGAAEAHPNRPRILDVSC